MGEAASQRVGDMAVAIRASLYRAVPDMPAFPNGILEPLLARFERELSTNKDETIAKLVEALKQADRAIAEYHRYWTGGETRGSYDGKPERRSLWEAQHAVRAALTSTKKEG